MSQRDRLMARPRPSAAYPLLVDADGAERAKRRLAVAQARRRQILLRESTTDDERDQADAELAEAEAELAGCYETIVLHALLPGRVEKLIAAHPPTVEQLAEAKAAREQARQRGEQPPTWPAWDEGTFRPALLAESAPDSGLSADDWAAVLAERLSVGEVRGLWATCLGINLSERAADPLVLPKGSTTTRS